MTCGTFVWGCGLTTLIAGPPGMSPETWTCSALGTHERTVVTNLPIACTLTPAAVRARREGLLSELLRRATAHEELQDGHRLQFAAEDDALFLIARAVNAERQCCRFLRFCVTVEPDSGPISLELTGPAGTREFVSALLES